MGPPVKDSVQKTKTGSRYKPSLLLLSLFALIFAAGSILGINQVAVCLSGVFLKLTDGTSS